MASDIIEEMLKRINDREKKAALKQEAVSPRTRGSNMKNMSQTLAKYTRLSQARRVKVLRWLSRQPESFVLIAFQKQKEHYFRLSRVPETDRSILYLAALYLAADELYSMMDRIPKKGATTLEEVQEKTTLQAKQFKQTQSGHKYEKMLNLKSKIIKLIEEEKLSYRDVSLFLQRYHRLEVSHSYIATFYHNVRQEA